ncbi:hypothetical protein JAAARDRAFT_208888 [Jaapia argillacea MUCL 33604]|uniref:F-box domain-containing protein n=1 Tax=Jaapia argillacea MUCL 33604 TaxID=933084 RepID=A0A067PXS9_9AGAM|nr:hypothetical protein JAAARDRAFT_208888 [Jaapia argillacea MUCL 33604]
MSPPSITNIPRELLDIITDDIDKPRDILSLALSCRRLKDLLIPDILKKLEYATIIAPFEYHHLWDHLSSHPELACHVRVLSIAPDADPSTSPHVFDYTLGLAPDDVGAGFIAAIISTISHVVKSMCVTLASLLFGVIDDEKDRDALSGFGSLISILLKIGVYLLTCRVASHRRRNSQVLDLPNLTHLHIDAGSSGRGGPVDSAAVDVWKRFLLGCPKLKCLSIFHSRFTPHNSAVESFDAILDIVHWRYLKKLDLWPSIYSSSTFNKFLARHPSIEWLDLSNYSGPQFPVGSFQHLHYLSGDLSAIRAIAPSKPPSLRTIFYLCHIDNSFGPQVDEVVRAFKSMEPTLRCVELVGQGRPFWGDYTDGLATRIHARLPRLRIDLHSSFNLYPGEDE